MSHGNEREIGSERYILNVEHSVMEECQWTRVICVHRCQSWSHGI